jgi:hypothetical protein
MLCPSCAIDNDERRRYCGQCGHNLRPVCVHCAFTNDASDKFCGGCGGALQQAPGVAATPVLSAPALPAMPVAAAVAAAPPPAMRSLPTPVKLAPMPPPARPALATLPVPAPAAVPAATLAATLTEAKASSSANGQPLVSAADLDFLIESKPAAKPEDSSLPARVTQSDLDSLFGDLA